MNSTIAKAAQNDRTTTPETLQAQYPGISALAADILTKEKNAYWRPREAGARVEAVEFPEAAFLAGPFDGKFGLVFIEHKPDALPLQEQLDACEKRMMDDCSTTYMPYSACQKLAATWPNGTGFHWDPVARKGYSDFDVPYLASEVRARLDLKPTRCQLFADTPEGKIELMEQLSAAEQDAFVAKKREAAARVCAEMARTDACAERPYRVRLQGNDDSSWTVAVATEQDVDALLQELRQTGYDAVYARMAFTN